MKRSVANAFVGYTIPLEAMLSYMYNDQLGKVTTGLGNLIDTLAEALALPWIHQASGVRATQQEITTAWQDVKAHPEIRAEGVTKYALRNDLRLQRADVDALVQAKLQNNERILRGRYPSYDNWPADAQLAIHSMSWVLGPAFQFPRFANAVNRPTPDFSTAAIESRIPGAFYDRRNAAQAQMFMNAVEVVRTRANPETLFYPGKVAPGINRGLIATGIGIGLVAAILIAVSQTGKT